MKIGKYLSEHEVSFEVHQHPPAYTAQEVAAEEHVSGNILAKSVLVHDEQAYALCVLPASRRLDMGKVARALHVKRVRLADESELAEVFADVEVGAEPHFGCIYDLRTLVDRQLAEDEEIVFQAGTHRQAIRMRYADYQRLTGPKVADLAVHL